MGMIYEEITLKNAYDVGKGILPVPLNLLCNVGMHPFDWFSKLAIFP